MEKLGELKSGFSGIEQKIHESLEGDEATTKTPTLAVYEDEEAYYAYDPNHHQNAANREKERAVTSESTNTQKSSDESDSKAAG